MQLAPIIIFAYNRPEHLRQTIESLSKNILADKTTIFIFSDGPKDNNSTFKVLKVREYLISLKKNNYFKEMITFNSPINKGLAKSIIEGITYVFKFHKKVIVLEDDLITSVNFINFMNDSLNYYEKFSNIGSVTAYNPLINLPSTYTFDTFLVPRNSSLGWGTWKDVWNTIDWNINDYSNFKSSLKKRRQFNSAGMDRASRLDNQIQKNAQSWSIRFGYNLFKNGLLTVYSSKNRITHIGWDGSGTHTSKNITKFNNVITNDNHFEFNELQIDKQIVYKFKKLYGSGLKQEVKEVILIIKNLFYNEK